MLSERSWFGYCTKLLVLRAAISHLPCYFKMSWFGGASYTFLSRAVSHQRHQETQSGS